MKVHVLQHGLQDMHSHYYGESVHLKQAIEGMGAEFALYVNERCLPALLSELGAQPTFRYPTDYGFDPDPVSKELSTFVMLGVAFSNDLVKHLPSQFGEDEWVLVPYASQVEAYGVGAWLSSLPATGRPKVVLFCHRPEFKWQLDSTRTQIQADASFWRWAGNLIKAAVGPDNCVIATGGDRLADFLSQFSTLHKVVSGLATAYFLSPAEAAHVKKEVDIGMMGEHRPERGSKIVAPVLAAIDRLQPGLTYRLQVMTPPAEVEVRAELDALGFKGQLEVITGMLPPAQFERMLVSSRLAVLPYIATRYALRTSGVFSQATAYGIPLVVPDRTWLSDAVRAGQVAGVMFEEWTADAIAAATVQAWQRLPALSAQAATLAPTWRLKNSPSTVLAQMMQALAIPLPSQDATSAAQ